MSGLTVVWMVARREIRARLLTKANVISLSVMVALIAIGAVVGGYFMDRDGESAVTRIALGPGVERLAPELEAAAAERKVDLEVSELSADDARRTLEQPPEGAPLDAFLDGDPAAPTMFVETVPGPAALELVTAAVRSFVTNDQVSGLGGDPDAFAQAIARAVPQVEALEEPDVQTFDEAAFGVATVMITLLFGTLVATGSMIAMGVVEEKTSRVVEILLSTIRPTQLLAGKVLGIGAYGLFQVLVLGGALAVAGLFLGVESRDIDVGATLLSLIMWFLVGYVVYALLFGGLAALVSRQEDIGTVTTPLTFLLVIPFYATMFLVPGDPDGTLVRVLSPIPFFAPFMLPVRQAMGVLEPWELPLGLGVSALAIPALVWVAARLYQSGVLHTGGRMKLRDALQSQPAEPSRVA